LDGLVYQERTKIFPYTFILSSTINPKVM
jgi:hypothetical protein